MYTRGITTAGYAVLLLLSAVMMLLSGIIDPIGGGSTDFGLCIPSPNLWPLLPWASRLINGLGIFICSVWLMQLNRGYNIVRSADMTYPGLFIILAACNPLASGTLNGGLLLLIINLIGISVLFGCYQSRNATQEVFAHSTFLSLGSMFDLGIAVMIPMWIVAMAMLKILRVRELIAFILGLAAPWWVAIGFGWLPIEAIHLPLIGPSFTQIIGPSEVLSMFVGLGVLFIVGALAALNTSVKLYAGNPRPRTFNFVIYLMALYCAIAMVLDASDSEAYMLTFFATVSAPIANLFALNHIPRSKLWLSIISILAICWRFIIFL